MANTHETIADIAQKIRDAGFDELSDHIMAAHKREVREAVTCSNQLREALKRLDELLYIGADGDVHGAQGKDMEIERIIKDALAAPATAEKSSAVGDAAKLREAVAELIDAMYELGIDEKTIVMAAESKHCHTLHLSAIKKRKPPLPLRRATAIASQARRRHGTPTTSGRSPTGLKAKQSH